MDPTAKDIARTVIVVGSGASAVHAAWPLVEAGIHVTMLDFGNRESHYSSLIPAESFTHIRQYHEDQHRYLLGEHFEGLQFGDVTVGAQLTPPRQYISAHTSTLTPSRSASFFFMESLAAGGLASGWGAGCFPYSSEELSGFHLSGSMLEHHYFAVARRIGMCGVDDDLSPFYGGSDELQPPLAIDGNAKAILAHYQAEAAMLQRKGFFLGHPRLAALSQPFGERSGSQYLEMEFWSDSDKSVYRPAFTLEELKRRPNFSYRDGYIVESFREEDDAITLRAYKPANASRDSFRAGKVILAAGTFGTARIVLRSFDLYGHRIPLVCNPYTYVPMVNLHRLGKTDQHPRYSLTQLCAVLQPQDSAEGILHAQLYSYRSLLSFKLMKEIPLPFPYSMHFVRMMLSSLCILGIHHEDHPTKDKFCTLEKGAPQMADVLHVEYALDKSTETRQNVLENRLLRLFRKLGCYGLKKIRNGHGSSIHYGGTFPISPENNELTVSTDCRLRPTQSVYIADGSVFPYLPAKGPTFTMMANADRVGSHVRDRILNE